MQLDGVLLCLWIKTLSTSDVQTLMQILKEGPPKGGDSADCHRYPASYIGPVNSWMVPHSRSSATEERKVSVG